nr:hypothetical protein [Tanacetum cinerariifolium]
MEESMLPYVHHLFLLWERCNQTAKSRYNTKLAQLLHRLIYSACVVDWNVLYQMGCGEAIDEMLIIKLFVAGTNEEIYTFDAWTNAFNIDEPIYSELCHEFYSAYEFDEVCVDEKLRTKKIIKFRLCGRAFSWTLLEFARWTTGYDKMQKNNWSLLSMFEARHQNGYGNVAWLITRTTGYDKMQKNNWSLLSMFEARHQNGYGNVAWLITRWVKRKGAEVLNSLSAPIYCRALDTTTLRELIDSEGRLITKVPEPCVPRVAILRPPRASMQGLYERMGSMEILQG